MTLAISKRLGRAAPDVLTGVCGSTFLRDGAGRERGNGDRGHNSGGFQDVTYALLLQLSKSNAESLRISSGW